jgi:hypothetical protein
VQIASAYADGVRARFPMVPQDGVLGEIKLVDSDGRVLGGAAAIARSAALPTNSTSLSSATRRSSETSKGVLSPTK